MEGAPRTLWPPDARDAYSIRAIKLVFSSLFYIDRKGNLKPDIAESFWIEDSKIYIRLAERYFCSGRKIVADDVKFSFERFLEKGRIRHIRKIQVISDNELVFYLEKTFFPILFDLTIPIFSEDKFDCSGDFQVVDFKPSEFVLLKHRKKDFFVLIRGVKDDLARILEFEKGDIDIIVNAVPYHLVEYVKNLPGVFIHISPGVNLTYIAFNTKRVPLEVRRAFAYAIPRHKIAQKLYGNLVQVSDTFLPPSSGWAIDFNWYEYNPKKAHEILKGQKVRLIWKTSTVRYAIRNIKVISNYLRKVGIFVKIKPREFGVFFDDISKGKFDVFSLNLVRVLSPDVLLYLLHSKYFPPSGINRAFFSKPELDALLDEAMNTFDKKKIKEKLFKIHKIVKDYVPYIPLWFNNDVIVLRTEKISPKILKNIEFLPGGDLSFLKDIAKFLESSNL